MSAQVELTAARYGKANIRVFRVVREGEWHHAVEYYVTVLVEGDIDISYTQADNSVIVATDSIKNITYYLAKISPHILTPERFALHLGTHIVSKYSHLHKVFVDIEQLRWNRIPVAKKPDGHAHAFYRDGNDKRLVKVEVDASAGKDKIVATVKGGIADLLVLKTTNSAFDKFVRDGYTTLAEIDDRILSTSIDLSYTFAPINIPAPRDEAKLEFSVPVGELAGGVWDVDVPAKARTATLDVFGEDSSASVQATLYKMATRIIEQNSAVQHVTYALPNKHYIPVDMSYIGVQNVRPESTAEVFMPIETPSGMITATVSRK